MLRPRLDPVLLAAAALLLAVPVAAQQPSSNQQSSGSAQQPAPQKKKDKKEKSDKKQSTADQNAFPEAQSEQAAHQAQQHGQQQNPPSAPAPSAQPRSEADQNPFPEAESENAAKEAQQRQDAAQNGAATDQDSGSSSSSSSSVVKGLNLPTTGAKQPPGAAPGPNPSLGRQDTKVGNFYLQSGDWKGAYSRFLEATQVDPADADAVFGLAESARHMGDNKTAIQNYQIYLSALPDGKHAKECRKALKDLGAKP